MRLVSPLFLFPATEFPLPVLLAQNYGYSSHPEDQSDQATCNSHEIPIPVSPLSTSRMTGDGPGLITRKYSRKWCEGEGCVPGLH
ncbi:hypothetical protein NPIL_23311 [Nephila pilipes]|uniref:Uncharacterized protein n=1 Tax=Nephila pilipes TaxID=299642 RepID=A0A8X6NTP2_NEPPI|nr:hypothetical protein NPIL_23311 [Nephila pilipes]